MCDVTLLYVAVHVVCRCSWSSAPSQTRFDVVVTTSIKLSSHRFTSVVAVAFQELSSMLHEE